MAAGVDRIVMLLAGEQNLREVALFPMNQRAEDLLMGAPSPATPKQLRELTSGSFCRRNEPMFEGFERYVVQVDEETSIACATAGAGPPVLLLHGFPQTRAMWARIAPRLAEAGYSVVCADLRGYGESSKPKRLPDNSNYSFRAFAEDQVRLMRALTYERFHVIGHDRGGRTAHRMALDHPRVIQSIAVLDIVPTYAMFMETNRQVAGAYWHWYFLSQPEPFPERMIGADPDFFYETCLVGWGAAKLADFDAPQLEAYRDAWRDPAMIHGSCSDYRAAATIDLDHDAADLTGRWRRRCSPSTARMGSWPSCSTSRPNGASAPPT